MYLPDPLVYVFVYIGILFLFTWVVRKVICKLFPNMRNDLIGTIALISLLVVTIFLNQYLDTLFDRDIVEIKNQDLYGSSTSSINFCAGDLLYWEIQNTSKNHPLPYEIYRSEQISRNRTMEFIFKKGIIKPGQSEKGTESIHPEDYHIFLGMEGQTGFSGRAKIIRQNKK